MTMTEEDGHLRSAKKMKATKRTFADTVSGSPPLVVDEDTRRLDDNEWAFEDPEIESDSEMDEQLPGDGRPRVKFSKDLRKELCRDWKLALIIKYLGKNINAYVLNQRLTNLWKVQDKFNVIDIGYGCFVVRFNNKKDYLHVLLDGPWKVFDNYLVVQRWVPEYKPRTAKLSKMAVWVRLPELSMEYFRDDIIKSILENVGKPLKLDRTTVAREKGRFARAAVEVDLDKPLVTEVLIQNDVQMVEYEGLHVVCFGCGLVGHREQDCPLKNPKPAEPSGIDINVVPTSESEGSNKVAEKTQPPKAVVAPSRGFGPWMLVQNKSKQVKQKTPQKQTNKAGEKHAASSNQFAALAENGRTPVHDTNPRGKSKTPTGKGDNSRGKAPAHPTPTPPPARQDPSPSTRQNSQGGRTPHSRGRGNSSAAPRNNGRGGNRGGFTKPSGQSASTERTDPNAGSNVFHFGSTSSAANASRGGGSPTSGSGAPNVFTPREGGNSTSLPPTVSQ